MLIYFVQKQSDLLLNSDDLAAMWNCLRENCVIDDATGAEKVYTHKVFAPELRLCLSTLIMILIFAKSLSI